MHDNLIDELLAAFASRSPEDAHPDSTPMLRAMRSSEPKRDLLAQPYRPTADDADADTVVSMALGMIFGKPLIMNAHRGVIVEAIVNIRLDNNWKWTGADWGDCDFVHVDGTRLEVKQSAARQSWVGDCVPRPTFDIAPRSGRWEGTVWRSEPGRNADIYLFAYHPLTSPEADHRDPEQWRFHVVAATLLPKNKSIGLKAVQRLSEAVAFGDLADALEAERKRRHAGIGEKR